MVVGNAPEAVDLVVIGAGPGGYTAALHAASRGRDVTLIDRGGDAAVGGVCLHAGCIPSKTLIEAAGVFHRSQHSKDMGVSVDSAHFDLAQFHRFKGGVIDGLAGGVRGKLTHAGVSTLTGTARFMDSKTLVLSAEDGAARFLQFKDCIVATGSRPVAVPGFAFGERVLDAHGALQLDTVPSTLAVVGGGYIGLELGCAFAKLGTAVSVVEALDRVLPTLPAGPAVPLQRRMASLGVRFHFGCRATAYDGGALTIADAAGDTHALDAEYVLMAVGRTPNTDDLELEAAGLGTNAKGLLEVDIDRRLTPHIAAIGDITPGPALAHKASAEAIVAVDALCGDTTAFEPEAMPLIVFTDPEIAHVGLDADQAKADGIDASSHKLPLRASGRAATLGETDGYVELTRARDDGTLLGATVVGPHASELIAELCVAIELGASVEDLALTVHPHPTLSELTMDVAGLAGR
ncbi:MAG: dihydrolipoyl dehydrogenase [Pseudomonadota bacterium]